MAEVTQWVVNDLSKDDRNSLVAIVEECMKSKKLAMPRISEIVCNGRKVIVKFPIGNSKKVRQLLAMNGFHTVTIK